jgi:hypothetical protein
VYFLSKGGDSDGMMSNNELWRVERGVRDRLRALQVLRRRRPSSYATKTREPCRNEIVVVRETSL